MAVREISTRLTLTGENSFNNALKAMNRNMKLLDAEMKKASVTFGEADQREELLSKQSDLLTDKLQQQKNIVAALEQELEQAAAAYGDNDQRVDRLRISLSKAQTEEAKINRELEETGRELREIQSPLRRAGNAIEDNLTDQAREARAELDDMLEGIQNDLGSIKFSTGFSAFKDFGEGIADIWSGLDGFVAGTRDYRRQMAYLAQNAEAAGEDFARVKQMAMEVAALTGDMDGAVEGLSNLLAAGYKGEGLANMVNSLASAAIRFPDTLKFENLAEALQETLATGAGTGAFGELLERLGFQIEEVNKALENSKSKEGRMQDIAGFLGITDLETYYKDFAEKNAALLEEALADQKWQDALANIGGQISGFFTPLKSEMADVINAWAGTLAGEDGSTEKLDKELGDVGAVVNTWALGVINNVTKATSEMTTKVITDAENAMKRAAEILSGEKPPTESEVEQATSDLMGAAEFLIGSHLTGTAGFQNWWWGTNNDGWLKTSADFAQSAFQHLRNGIQGKIGQYEQPIGPELPESMKQTMEEAGGTAGTAAGQSLADAIAAKQGEVEAAVQSITDAVNRIIDKVKPIEIKVKDNTGAGGTGTGQAFGGGNSGDPLEFNFNVDGVSLGRVMAPYVSREMGKAASLRVRTGRG